MKPTIKATVIILAILVIAIPSAISCSSGSDKDDDSTARTVVVSNQTEVVKPKPVVLGIKATTTGWLDSYHAILDVTVENQGADGMIIVRGSINQANKDVASEIPVYLAQDVTQEVRIVLPLAWRGGDWTPNAVVEIP